MRTTLHQLNDKYSSKYFEVFQCEFGYTYAPNTTRDNDNAAAQVSGPISQILIQRIWILVPINLTL